MARNHQLPTDRGLGVGNALFVVAMALVGVAAAWPIYQAPWFWITAFGAIIAGGTTALIGAARSWSWTTVLLATVGVYLLLGVPLAIPSALGSVQAALAAELDLLVATFGAWKQLVTVAIPAGSYQAVLVPALLVFLGGSSAAFSLAWRTQRLAVLVVPIMFVVQLFGLVFGSSATAAPVTVFGTTLPASRELAVGILGFAIAAIFLSWRARHIRRAALLLAMQNTGVRRRSEGMVSRIRRAWLAGTVLVVAVALAVPIAATAALPAERDVLRTAVDPAVQLREQVSPLSQYRAAFGSDRYDAELLRVETSGAAVERLRLAVLSHYDGTVFRVIAPDAGERDQSTAFARVPHTMTPEGPAGEQASIEVGIAAYDGIWLPTAGSLVDITFAGDRRQALTDGFFYNAGTAAGVQLARVTDGDRYTITTQSAPDAASLRDLEAPAGGSLIDGALIPEKLAEWVRAQRVSEDGAGLAELITRLRERGYLSHALAAPADPETSWAADLRGHAFEPSTAGHSIDRIDAMFAALLEKQATAGATDNTRLVAAVGDDEQFATAAALIAAELGFTARVVIGFILDEAATDAASVPACAGGVCSGRNLTAWVEVADGRGGWVAVNATPQHVNPLSPIDDQRSDPRIDTEVITDGATEQRAPKAPPSAGDDAAPTEDPEAVELDWLMPLLRIAGIMLLVVAAVCAPFLAIIAAKLQRRRSRRRADDEVSRIANGWDEYVDTAIDHGLPGQGSLTRSELAIRHGRGDGARELARLADAAVFAPPGAVEHDSREFWAIVDAERASLIAASSRMGRLKAALSLRSFTRILKDRGVGS
jgi:hypothetical protein